MKNFMRGVCLTIVFSIIGGTQFLFAQGSWSWQNPLPQGNELESVFFVNDETGWVVGQKGIIIKTTDGGTNWEIQNSGTMKDLFCVYFINSDVGFTAGSNGTILKTTDGGDTWNTQTNTFPDNSSIRTVFFVNENVGWAGGSNYILSTKDGGTTWLRFDDWWATWVYSMFFLNDQVGFWVGRMVKKTTDGGTTWNELNSWDNGIPFVYEYYDIFFVDNNVGWITCSDGSILKTTDGGGWWTVQSQLNNAGSIFFKDQNTGWAAVYGEGIFKTEDGGVNWSKSSIKGIEDIFFSQTNGFLVGKGGKILKSVDEGNQWIDAYQNLVPNINLNSVFFNDAQLGFAIGDSGKILKTEDSGNTWLHQTSPMNRNLNSIYFTDANTGWIAGYEVILKTNNRGEAWQLKYISTYADFNDIYFVNSDTGWVVGDKIHITENGGQSWTPQTLPNVSGNYYLNGVFFSDKLNGWVVGNNGRMFNTIDGGVAWQKVIVPTTEDLFGIKFVDDNIGWIVGENGTILKSNDSGTTWNIQNYNTDFDLYDIFFFDTENAWTVGGKHWSPAYYGGATVQTNDGGNSWIEHDNPCDNTLFATWFTDINNGWSVGEEGTIIKYTNSYSIPAYPADLIATAAAHDKINLTWVDNADNENGFDILRSDLLSGSYKKISNVVANTTSYVDSSLSSEVTYWYRVVAYNESGNSAWSREDSATTFMVAPAAPILASPSNGADVQPTILTLSWNPCAYATTYHLQVSTDLSFTTLIFDNDIITNTQQQIGPLPNCATYYWRVNAKNAAGASPYSEPWSFATEIWSALISGTSDWLWSVYFVDASIGWAVGWSGTILNTSDGGYTWNAQTSGISSNLRSVHFADAQTGWAVGDDGIILKTTNGGISWTAQSSGTSYDLRSVYFIDASTGWAVGVYYTILKTTNGGNSWTALSSGFDHHWSSVYFQDATTGWLAGTSGAIIKTTDGGTSWNDLSTGTYDLFNSVNFVNYTTGWVVADNGIIFKTSDGGTNWTAQTSGISVDLNSVYFVDASTGWTVGRDGKILNTIDGGKNWTEQSSGTSSLLSSVYFIDTGDTLRGWVAGIGGRILKTTMVRTTPSVVEKFRPQQQIPGEFALLQNYPNPFNATTTIKYRLPKSGFVTLKIFNLAGQEIQTLVNKYLNAGEHEIKWTAKELPSGIYFYRLQTSDFSQIKKLILQK